MSGIIVAAAAASAASAASAPVAVGITAAEVGFFAGLAGFVGGFLLTWPALVVLAILGVLFEHNGARAWAVTTALATAAVSYFFFGLPLLTILIGAGAYVVIGLIWSVWRYKRHVDKTVEANRTQDERTRQRVVEGLHPKAMLSTITAWVLIWPFSMVENVAGDLINAIETLVSKIFRGVYHKIYNSAVAALNIPSN